MRRALPIAAAALFFATSAHAETELEKGFAGALRGCEEWVLNPASWAKGPAPFIAAVGLGDKMGLVGSVPEISLPPPEYRTANHYWRINSTPSSGFVLVVSDKIPMCHVTGGGDVDMQPTVEAVLATGEFAGRWELVGTQVTGDMTTGVFRNRKEPAFSIVISRAKSAGQRLDRVQVLATAGWKLAK